MIKDRLFVSKVRAYLLRKNLASIPFEIAGSAIAIFFTDGLAMALVSLLVADLVGEQVGRRVANASKLLDTYSVEEVKAFKDNRLAVRYILLATPLAVGAACWIAGLAGNQSVALAGLVWSIATLAYRYWSHIELRNELSHA